MRSKMKSGKYLKATYALGVRYNFGTIGGEKEWFSGSKATPNEALGFFEFLVGI